MASWIEDEFEGSKFAGKRRIKVNLRTENETGYGKDFGLRYLRVPHPLHLP